MPNIPDLFFNGNSYSLDTLHKVVPWVFQMLPVVTVSNDNILLKPLLLLVHVPFTLLFDRNFLASQELCHTLSRIRCMRFSGRIKSLQNSEHAHYSDAIECNLNYRNATHKN